MPEFGRQVHIVLKGHSDPIFRAEQHSWQFVCICSLFNNAVTIQCQINYLYLNILLHMRHIQNF